MRLGNILFQYASLYGIARHMNRSLRNNHRLLKAMAAIFSKDIFTRNVDFTKHTGRFVDRLKMTLFMHHKSKLSQTLEFQNYSLSLGLHF